ncbi:MAG: CRTAC1 family protein [Thermoanaerobaculia bacterium]
MSAVAHIDEYKTGRFYTDEYRGTSSWNGYENNVLLRNEGCAEDGVPRFVDVAQAVGADDIQDSRGIAFADFDRDGDLDVAINHNPGDADRPELGQARLLINRVGSRRPSVELELEGVSVNRDAVGTVVTVEAGGTRQVRRVEAGSSYASQHSPRLHFGLGENDRIDRLQVRWPDGSEQEFSDLEAGRLLRLRQGGELESVPFVVDGPAGTGDAAAG